MSTLTGTRTERFIEKSAPFLSYLKRLEGSWEDLDLTELVRAAGGPDKVCIIGVDLLEGFCRVGPLASPRVHAIVEPAVRVLEKCHELGVRDLVFTCDSHPADSPEFQAYPSHCVEGTEEAELVKEIQSLPFASEFTVMSKRSIDSFVGSDLGDFLDARPGLTTIVALGDCTDICLYQLATALRSHANVHHHAWEVIVPASVAETYDLPIEVAEEIGAMPHDGDLLHLVFLYHLQLNGVRIVKDLR